MITHLAFYAGWPAAMSAGLLAAPYAAAAPAEPAGPATGPGTGHEGRLRRRRHDGPPHGRQPAGRRPRPLVHDLRPEAAADHVAAGATWAATPGRAGGDQRGGLHLPARPGRGGSVATGPTGCSTRARRRGLVRPLHELADGRAPPARRASAQGIELLDAPVSGGPRGARPASSPSGWAASGRPSTATSPCCGAFSDQPYYVGPIGAGSAAKLVHNCAGYVLQTALAEVFTLGVKAGVDPVDAVEGGAARGHRAPPDVRRTGRTVPGEPLRPAVVRPAPRPQGRVAGHSARPRAGRSDAASKPHAGGDDRSPRPRLGRRDSRVAMLLQEERAGVEIEADREALRAVFAEDPR